MPGQDLVARLVRCPIYPEQGLERSIARGGGIRRLVPLRVLFSLQRSFIRGLLIGSVD